MGTCRMIGRFGGTVRSKEHYLQGSNQEPNVLPNGAPVDAYLTKATQESYNVRAGDSRAVGRCKAAAYTKK